MKSPKTIDQLIQHLRDDCGIEVSTEDQKKQLISYGYYHGYKGYRFFQKSNIRIPYSDFDELIAVIEYDNNLKSALYPSLMFIETAIKNIVCNESVKDLDNGTFESVYNARMRDNPTNTKLQSKRLELRNRVYSSLSKQYKNEKRYSTKDWKQAGRKRGNKNKNINSSKMISHYYERGEDVPLWALFEIRYLSDLADFFSCLNEKCREEILNGLDMADVSVDTDKQLLRDLIFTLKALRNSVAHNRAIFDARFKDRDIANVLKKWVQKETGISNITLYSLIDYIIILCTVLKRVDFSGRRAKELVITYKNDQQILKENVSEKVYSQIVQKDRETKKIEQLEVYLNS